MMNFTASILLLSILITSLLQFSCSQQAYSNVSCIARERKALLQFRDSLIDGSNWFSSWSGEDCCKWEGVGCNKTTGYVVKLDLHNPNQSNSGFRGKINSSLLALEHLNYLDLSMNNFSEIQIPVFLGSLKNIKYLNLSGSGFIGNIPHELGNLSRLQHLDLSLNSILTAKSFSWVATLSSLKSLDLSGANFNESQDWFPAINRLSSLMSLKLSKCQLYFWPSLPHVNLTSLSILDLSGNFFNSSIPLVLYNMTSLKHLYLFSNYFHGLIDDKVSQLTSLTTLDLSSNELMAPLPSSFGSLTTLHHLYLVGNKFSGSLPLKLFYNMTSLVELYLCYNEFQGSIPRDINRLGQLRALDLSGNELNGTVPSNIGLLTNLEFLYLSSNPLIGEISEVHFAKLKNLKYLILYENSLTLNVRSSWIPPFQLERIWMCNVKIGPHFPSWLQTQKNLLLLSLANASISDDIPSWFEIVQSHIYYLDLSSNNITGKFPKLLEMSPSHTFKRTIVLSSNKLDFMSSNSFASDISNLDLSGNHIVGTIPLPKDLNIYVSLRRFLLNDNYFSGSIPESICYISSLGYLDLSNNQLSGRLPLCLGNLRDLVVLKVTNNSLYGEVPSSLGNLEFLRSLGLNKNKFHGKLPISMQYLTHMQFLDLGENEFDGIIPSWIGKFLLELRVLRLQSNHFYGDIPLHLCPLSKVQVLNLARNSLTGSIPSCFSNLTAMASNNPDWEDYVYLETLNGYQEIIDVDEKLLSFMGGRELAYNSNNVKLLRSLDLSQNNISGGIPEELTDLVGLKSLKLSQNHLTGNIPEKIGNLKQLLSLDLSMNELSGSIPQSLRNLNFLSYLNLSSNKLSGRIPMGTQLQTLTDPSIYAGNSGLYGKPLSNNCSNENKPSFKHKDEKESIFLWFYAGLGLGFAVGLLLIFFILFFKKSWRIAYFQFVEYVSDKIWAWSVRKTSKIQRKLA